MSPVPPVYSVARYAAAVSGSARPRPPDQPQMISYHGHGTIERAAPGQSVAHVMAHERAHIASYRSMAFQRGYDIAEQDIGIRFEMRDGKLVAVAGEATARLEKRSEPDGQAAPTPEPGETESQPAPATEDQPFTQQTEQRLETVENEARARLRAAERSLRDLRPDPAAPEQAAAIDEAAAEATEAAAALREIEAVRQAERIARAISDLSGLVQRATDASTRVAARIAYAATGAAPRVTR